MVPEIASKKREAEPILLRFGKATIHLLIYAKRLYIPTHEGLRLIGVEPNWLNVGKKSRRERLLKRTSLVHIIQLINMVLLQVNVNY